MRRCLRQALLLLLCASLLPGWGELWENIEHLVLDGHLAHGSIHEGEDDHAAHRALGAEHGCTPISHTCGCHASVPVLIPGGMDFPHLNRIARERAKYRAENDTIAHRAQAPPVPPPRA